MCRASAIVIAPSPFENNFHDCSSYRPVLRDLSSSHGTVVEYDGEGGGIRKFFRWILGGHEAVDATKKIVITIAKGLRFKVKLFKHGRTEHWDTYNVQNCFHSPIATVEDSLDALDLPEPTKLVNGSVTSDIRDPILIKHSLGSGGFGEVEHVWDVSSGEEYALKQPLEIKIRKREVDEQAWEREAYILGKISHDNIVKFLGATFDPFPQLRLEFCPLGSLEQANLELSGEENVQILGQGLSALAYLRGLEPRIVHRDLKPDNILIKRRGQDGIHIKLSDFGLSHEKSDLTTLCGTRRYMAPEIHYESIHRWADCREQNWRYTWTVDIWSLGVLVWECAFDLPSNRGRGADYNWCQPEKRLSAKQCYDLLCKELEKQALEDERPLQVVGQSHDQDSNGYGRDRDDKTVIPATVYCSLKRSASCAEASCEQDSDGDGRDSENETVIPAKFEAFRVLCRGSMRRGANAKVLVDLESPSASASLHKVEH
ncbi:hypothetical protein E4U42_006952 [Claviceps africana]|uniref:IkappaB kinase n=1 Tax=Claviceps africana TaxID=83212 RepID=A0A8K0J2D2_9HYPO|nr:hypothetical protein E4U42_006952 [Claviceps africana]